MHTTIIQLTQLAPQRRSPFGEFLVEQQVLTRFELFRALQLQDRVPGTRLGQCAVALGYAANSAIEHLHHRFTRLPDLETMTTGAFEREPEVEIIHIPS